MRPALRHIDLCSQEAVQLVIGTGLAESGLKYIKQINGVALGLFQMEPATERDILKNFLAFKPQMLKKVMELRLVGHIDGTNDLQSSPLYAAAMCRIHYFRVKGAIPKPGDIVAMAQYWKENYNTIKGAGTIDHFIRAAQPILHLGS